MEKNLVVIFCWLLVVHACVEGMVPLPRRRCRCSGSLANRLNVKEIKRLEVYPLSSICEKMDVIAILKSGKKICLNPHSTMVKILFEAMKNKWGKPQ
ncbi:C-X-C motif chemokine 9-like [Spea bombifrons]|uniref:C-X-C motif chemokine 9-like n=1 Tax=Spea bombifrons TaxID=233779 RepID=UPI00234B9C66|nr:C-X-C motif chemokine 9-like [Spea bombifrons]